MVVVFANNLTMVVLGGVGTTTVFSDPVPMEGNDRVAPTVNPHQMDKTAGTMTLAYQAQVSSDGGQNFTNVSGLTESVTATGAVQKTGTALGQLLRFKFTLTLTGVTSSDVGVACFDLHAVLDHA